MQNNINLKTSIITLLKILPCFFLLYLSINITSYLVKNIIFSLINIYLLILLSKSNFIISSILALFYILFASLNNLGLQKEITYLQLIQFSIIYLFSLYFSTSNKILRKNINKKDKTLNKDYITGLFNKRYLDELIMTNYSPKYKDTYALSFEIDDFKYITSKVGYSQSENILRDIAKILKKEINNNGICFKLEGENFLVLIDKEKEIDVELLVDRFKTIIENTYFNINNTELNVLINISIISSTHFKNPKEYLDNSIRGIKNAKHNKQGIYFGLNKEHINIKKYN